MKFHESIKSLPVRQWQFWQKVTEILLNVGQDKEAVLKHIERVGYFISKKREDLAVEELRNMQQAVKFAFSQLDFNNVALGALAVYDKKVSEDDMSGFKATKEVKGSTTYLDKEEIQQEHEKLRKKLLAEFEQYFPSIAHNDNHNEIDALRAKGMQLAKALQEGEEGQAESLMLTIIEQHLEEIKPKNYTRNQDDLRELVIDKSFEKMNVIVSKYAEGRDVSEMSVFEYYTIVSQIEEESKRRLKQQRNGRNKME